MAAVEVTEEVVVVMEAVAVMEEAVVTEEDMQVAAAFMAAADMPVDFTRAVDLAAVTSADFMEQELVWAEA
jgi:hypothetical protein